MRKRPAQAIPFNQLHRGPPPQGPGGKPPMPEETRLDRIFTSLAHATGLTRHARASVVRQIEQIEKTAADLKVSVKIQTLHQQLNTIVDGGWRGLWTSIRVAAGMA